MSRPECGPGRILLLADGLDEAHVSLVVGSALGLGLGLVMCSHPPRRRCPARSPDVLHPGCIALPARTVLLA